MKSLTEGNEAKVIFFFAMPMLIGNVFQQMYTMVDSIIVGRGVGKEALAAVGASFPIIFLMVSLIIGITMGTSVMLSQYYGAKDYKKLKDTIGTSVIFLFYSALVVTVLGLVLSGPILRAVRIPDAVFLPARSYLRVMFAGMIFLFGYNTINAVLRGLGDSKTPLYFLIIATIINIFLDLLFVLVFKWGVVGAAWATVIAQGISFLVGIIYLRRSPYDFLHINVRKIHFDRQIFRTMLKIGLPSGVQQSLVSLGFIAMTRIVNPFGTNVIAAYTAASRLDSFAAMPAMNLSMAISTFVGQNLGAQKPERVRKGYIYALLIAGIISVLMSAVMIVFRGGLIGMFSTDAEVVRIGAQYLLIVSAFYLVFSSMFITNGVLRGAGDTMAQMIITVLALWAVRVPVAAVLSSSYGVPGIWWGIPAGWVVGLICAYAYFLSGRWKRKVLVKQVEEPQQAPASVAVKKEP